MATSTILLKTTVEGEFEVETMPRAFLSASYRGSDNARAIQPSTIFTKNTVTVARNIRSLNEREAYENLVESQASPIFSNNYYPSWNTYITDFVAIGQQSTAFLMHDFSPINGNEDVTTLDGEVIFKALQGNAGDGVISPPVKRYANFQNRLLFVRGTGCTLHEYSIDPVGDDNTPDNEGEFNQIAEVVPKGDLRLWRLYELTGINLKDPEQANQPGYTGPRVHGCVTAGNYFILYTINRIYWSNPLDFTDFTPTIGLAGSTAITGAKGSIINCVPNPQGFTVYCTGNIVHAARTGNAESPFVFSVVENSGSLVAAGARLLIGADNYTGTQLAFTSKGLQLIEGPVATAVPEKITSYLAELSMEVYNPATGEVDYHQVGSTNDLLAEKIKRIDVYQNNIFFYILSDDRTGPNMVVVFNTSTQAISRWYGRIALIYPVMQDAEAYDTVIRNLGWQYQRNTHPLKLWLVTVDFAEEVDGQFINTVFEPTTRIVDLADLQGDGEPPEEFEYEPSVVLTELGISPDLDVEIHSIKLQGINGLTASDRATIRVFTDVFSSTPVTFQYHEATDRYYGYICGRNPRVEITGRRFLLSTIEVEISRGADL